MEIAKTPVQLTGESEHYCYDHLPQNGPYRPDWARPQQRENKVWPLAPAMFPHFLLNTESLKHKTKQA